MSIDSERVALYRKELELCGVNSRETVAILSSGDGLRDRADTFAAAAAELGATVDDVRVASAGEGGDPLANLGVNNLGADRGAMERLKQADLVIDMMLLLWSKEQVEIQAAGTRILMAVDDDANLERLFPTPDLRRRTEAAERHMNAAKELRFTNAAGTDLRYNIEGSPVLTEYGYTDTPGRWDNWPGGLAATGARDGQVHGRVVLAAGDIVYTYPDALQIKQPVELQVEAGMITAITGGEEADFLRGYIDSYDDPRAYAVSHIGWGLNERCEWAKPRADGGIDIGMIDGRAYYGNVLFSTGPDLEIGGTNDTACHLDIPMLGCDLYLDGQLVLENGHILPDDMRVAGH